LAIVTLKYVSVASDPSYIVHSGEFVIVFTVTACGGLLGGGRLGGGGGGGRLGGGLGGGLGNGGGPGKCGGLGGGGGGGLGGGLGGGAGRRVLHTQSTIGDSHSSETQP
jgi:hypothetical protein